MRFEILKILKESLSLYMSGEVLSKRFGVTRTAVWKYVNELRDEGYIIESSSKKGYRLLSSPEIINGFEIGYNLGTAIIGRKILYFGNIDSTNNRAKIIAAEGCEDGTVVAAGMQTSGRGRLGRNWQSLDGKGIYLSVILKPDIAPEKTQNVTIAASAAAVRAIEDAAGMPAGIKWPNDIYLNGRKVCGILTEMNSETDRVNYVVCGIGINYSQERDDFPEELQDKAISVLSLSGRGESAARHPGRLELMRSLLKEFDRTYISILEDSRHDVVDFWKSRSLTLGREVVIESADRKMTGRAVDITNAGRLVVVCEDGITREILSGEVSVKGLDKRLECRS